jgi:type IV pilus assembly protein PilM
MAKQIVSLYIDDNSLRLMVTNGKKIKRWAESPLEPGLIENAAVIKETEVIAKIKQLFKVEGAKTKNIVLGMSGFHCLTRPITLPQFPKAMLDEAVRREAERALPVPLDELYISWQTIPGPKGQTRVFLAAIPRRIADPLLKVLLQAGLKPSFMDLKPLLLARSIREETAVIIDVQKSEFDIVIMVEGVPQPIRTVPFADDALSWQEKLVLIRDELERTITFYNSNNPETPLVSSIPIFASGGLSNELELCQALSDEIGRPVSLISSPLNCPDGFDPSLYLFNIGLFLQKLAFGKKSGPSVVNINALPVAYQPKPISLTNILVLPGTVIAVALVAFLIVLIQNASADISSMRAELASTNHLVQQRISQKNEVVESIAGLQEEIDAVQASQENFTAALGSLEKQVAGVNLDLDTTTKNLPSTVSLSSINHDKNILTISGRAPSEKGVLGYLLNLDSSGRFGDITITNMTRTEDDVMEFTLLGSLQMERYTVSSIEIAVNSLPSTVSLTSFSITNGILTINGRSPNEDDLLSYFQNLESSGKFHEIIINTITRAEDDGMEFSLALRTGE